MLASFSVDKNFFGCPTLRNEGLSLIHDFITESWLHHGVLVMPRGGDDEILALINTLPIKFRQRWKDVLEYGKSIEVDQQWWDFEDIGDFSDITKLSGLFSTAFTSDELGSYFGDPGYGKVCSKTGFELLGAGISSESVHFSKLIKAKSKEISEGESPRSVWSERFLGLAKYSKRIVVVDRYFFESIQRSRVEGRENEALSNFIKFLAEAGGRYNIKFISHGGASNDALHACLNDTFMRLSKEKDYKACVKNLTLLSAREEFFKKESHDRLIGFDKHVCHVGNGMRVLGKQPLPRSTFLAKFDLDGEVAARETSANSSTYKLWHETF